MYSLEMNKGRTSRTSQAVKSKKIWKTTNFILFQNKSVSRNVDTVVLVVPILWKRWVLFIREYGQGKVKKSASWFPEKYYEEWVITSAEA